MGCSPAAPGRHSGGLRLLTSAGFGDDSDLIIIIIIKFVSGTLVARGNGPLPGTQFLRFVFKMCQGC